MVRLACGECKMNFTPVPKPQHSRDVDETYHRTWREKAIDVAGKIACFNGRCSFCGRLGEIFPHHIIHRSYGNTTAYPPNIIPLCSICHADCHHDEKRFKAWLEQLKPGLYQKLWEIARPVCTLRFDEVYEDLLTVYHLMLVERQKEESRR